VQTNSNIYYSIRLKLDWLDANSTSQDAQSTSKRDSQSLNAGTANIQNLGMSKLWTSTTTNYTIEDPPFEENQFEFWRLVRRNH